MIPMNLGQDGFPQVGSKLTKGTSIFCVFSTKNKRLKIKSYKGDEPSYIQQATIVETGRFKSEVSLILKLRFERNPVLGDKFASRHG